MATTNEPTTALAGNPDAALHEAGTLRRRAHIVVVGLADRGVEAVFDDLCGTPGTTPREALAHVRSRVEGAASIQRRTATGEGLAYEVASATDSRTRSVSADAGPTRLPSELSLFDDLSTDLEGLDPTGSWRAAGFNGALVVIPKAQSFPRADLALIQFADIAFAGQVVVAFRDPEVTTDSPRSQLSEQLTIELGRPVAAIPPGAPGGEWGSDARWNELETTLISMARAMVADHGGGFGAAAIARGRVLIERCRERTNELRGALSTGFPAVQLVEECSDLWNRIIDLATNGFEPAWAALAQIVPEPRVLEVLRLDEATLISSIGDQRRQIAAVASLSWTKSDYLDLRLRSNGRSAQGAVDQHLALLAERSGDLSLAEHLRQSTSTDVALRAEILLGSSLAHELGLLILPLPGRRGPRLKAFTESISAVNEWLRRTSGSSSELTRELAGTKDRVMFAREEALVATGHALREELESLYTREVLDLEEWRRLRGRALTGIEELVVVLPKDEPWAMQLAIDMQAAVDRSRSAGEQWARRSHDTVVRARRRVNRQRELWFGLSILAGMAGLLSIAVVRSNLPVGAIVGASAVCLILVSRERLYRLRGAESWRRFLPTPVPLESVNARLMRFDDPVDCDADELSDSVASGPELPAPVDDAPSDDAPNDGRAP